MNVPAFTGVLSIFFLLAAVVAGINGLRFSGWTFFAASGLLLALAVGWGAAR